MPNNRPFEEDLSDAEIVRPRPEWLKLYYKRFADSTKLMDSEQVGWYWRLLLYAASQGEPPGYLNNNEEELRQIAEIKDLEADAIALLIKTEEGRQYLTTWKERRNRRWQKVLSKFYVSRADSNLLYNKMLVATLQDAYRKQKQTIRAGQLSWSTREQREENPKESKSSLRGSLRTDDNSSLTQLANSLPIPPSLTQVESKQPQINQLGADALPKPKQMSGYISLSVNNINNNVKSNDDVNTEFTFEQLSKIINEDKRSTLLRRKNETLFEEDRFEITEEMFIPLKDKHPDFVKGDWNFMVEEFRNVFYGKKKASWKRTFYTFVNNQRMRYGYEPGDYQRREHQPNAGREGNQILTYSRIRSSNVSAAERNQAAERAANELSARYLQESSLGNSDELEEALPLTADDIRNST